MLIKKLVDHFIQHVQQPRSNKLVRKLPLPGHSGDFVEAVFRPEIFQIFSDNFRCFPAGSGDFSASFLQDHARSGGWNHRPGKHKDLVMQ
jgi:hypothetical protein